MQALHQALQKGHLVRVFLSVVVVILSLFVCLSAEAGKNYGNVAVARVVSVYDGDTFRADLEGYPAITGENIPIRIKGIDTPGMRDKRPEIKALARDAREFTKDMLESGNVIILRNIERGKYFRIVADVYVDGVSLSHGLLLLELAKPYDGGKKPVW